MKPFLVPLDNHKTNRMDERKTNVLEYDKKMYRKFYQWFSNDVIPAYRKTAFWNL